MKLGKQNAGLIGSKIITFLIKKINEEKISKCIAKRSVKYKKEIKIQNVIVFVKVITSVDRNVFSLQIESLLLQIDKHVLNNVIIMNLVNFPILIKKRRNVR